MLSFSNVLGQKLSKRVIVVFLASSTVSILIVLSIIFSRISAESSSIDYIIFEKTSKINEIISDLLFKTRIVSTIITLNKGKVENFEQIAASIIDDPSILNILVAPSGIVEYVYPLQGNEAVLGLNFFSRGAGNKEAILAKEKGEIVFGGPFTLVQGGQALVGRLPVFLSTPGGGKNFWGLVSITLKYPLVLEGAGLDSLLLHGYAYELWRTDPDSNEKQIIAAGGNFRQQSGSRKEKHFKIFNSDWYFSVRTTHTWYEIPETWAMLLFGLLTNILIAFLVHRNDELRKLSKELEQMACIDPLTGVYNRRHFFELAATRVEMLKRTGNYGFIILFDLDYFKLVNDTYGHAAGDAVLRAIPERLKVCIRSYDLLARYGGEEFLMLITCTEPDDVIDVAERCRTAISRAPVKYGDINIAVTASFGVAAISSGTDIEAVIKNADESLYTAKNNGRNQCIFYWLTEVNVSKFHEDNNFE
ncbi:MAG: sensor domain-containing diguanylate cyclase [Desulfovibrio sp.]|nr:sensor domain-containing diguanylate cyclase [Desulfovibrio sp.]